MPPSLYANDQVVVDRYKQVVEKIKAVPNETRLLVVDQAADRYFADKGVAISGELSCIEHINCPATKPVLAGGAYSHCFQDMPFHQLCRNRICTKQHDSY